MHRVIGTCSECGGPVTVPQIWMGVHPPTPQCLSCHAIPENPFGPEIKMKKQSWSPCRELYGPARSWDDEPVVLENFFFQGSRSS